MNCQDVNTTQWESYKVSYNGEPEKSVCPCCGYCPHCGRGGYHAVPVYPTPPWYIGDPVPTWGTPSYPNWIVTSGTTTNLR